MIHLTHARLSFVNQYGNLKNKHEKYIYALQSMIEKFSHHLEVSKMSILSYANDFMEQINMKFSYDAIWIAVDQLVNKNQPESAEKFLLEIKNAAESDKNIDQIIKVFFYKMHFTFMKEEDALAKLIEETEEDIIKINTLAKPVLHSVLAYMYFRYTNRERSNIQQRTQTTDFEKSDIRTWTEKDLISRSYDHLHHSLADEKLLQQTNLQILHEVLGYHRTTSKNSVRSERKLRPTLFDFVAHNAINQLRQHYSYSFSTEKIPFALSEDAYLAMPDDFVKVVIPHNNNLSNLRFVLAIYQQLTAFHLHDDDSAALIHLTYDRLLFVSQCGNLQNKNEKYISTIKKMIEKFSDNPEVSMLFHVLAEHYDQLSFKYSRLENTQYRYYKKKAFEICQHTITNFDDTVGVERCKSLLSRIIKKNLRLNFEEVITPNQPFLSYVTYTNIEHLFFKIVAVAEDEFIPIKTKSYDYETVELIKKCRERPAIISKQVVMPDTEDDKQEHGFDIYFSGLAVGLYVLFASNEESFNGDINLSHIFQVTALSPHIHYERQHEQMQFRVLDRQSGQPVSGVKITIYGHNINNQKKILSTLTTDIQGRAILAKIHDLDINGEPCLNCSYSCEKDNDKLLSISDSSLDNICSDYHSSDNKQKHMVISVFTDRAAYRPRQSIYFKAVAYFLDGKNAEVVAVDTPLQVNFFDVNRQKIACQTLLTNEYGAIDGCFIAPMTLTGSMFITVNDRYSADFIVEDYKRPKFEVGFLPLNQVFRINDRVEIIGTAIAYSGLAIDSAQVVYRVKRQQKFLPWGFFDNVSNKASATAMVSCETKTDEIDLGLNEVFFDNAANNSRVTEIISGVTQTDENGLFKLVFDASADPNQFISAFYIFKVEVDVTDINGETHSAFLSVNLAKEAMYLELDLPKQVTPKNQNVEFNLFAKNFNYELCQATGTFTITRLTAPTQVLVARKFEQPDVFAIPQHEFKQFFPHEIYNNEDKMLLWPSEKMELEAKFDTQQSSKMTISGLSAGAYLLQVKSIDRFGTPVERKHYFTLFSENKDQLPYPQACIFETNKNSIEPNDELVFQIRSSFEQVYILFVLYRNDSILLQKEFWLKSIEKIPYIVTEEDRGGLVAQLTFVYQNRFYRQQRAIAVPFSNKILQVNFESFRDNLQPNETEQWTIKVTGPQQENVSAHMLLTLYDASLDTIKTHNFDCSPYHANYSYIEWTKFGFGVHQQGVTDRRGSYSPNKTYTYESLNWFFNIDFDESRHKARMDDRDCLQMEMMACRSSSFAQENDLPEPNLEPIKLRTNFNETAFFMPNLITNEDGIVHLSFTIPESLTKWRLLGFTHTKDFKYKIFSKELVTQKSLMVIPNAPRFFRENDQIIFAVKISNLAKKILQGTAILELLDGVSKKPLLLLDDQSFTTEAGGSALVKWSFKIPAQIQAITWRVFARADEFSDGEEMTLPVLTNNILVTETMPLITYGEKKEKFIFNRLKHHSSTTLKNHKLTLEFTAAPAWYAIQALPYLMEYPYECTEQIFSRYYANALATHIVKQTPKIKSVFDKWQQIDSVEMLSKLEQNQELKMLILEETPWLREAKSEAQYKKNIALLFDLSRMASELDNALNKLEKRLKLNGGFAWFDGMEVSCVISLHILSGFGHLKHLGVLDKQMTSQITNIIAKGLSYCDDLIAADYDYLLRHSRCLTDDHLSYRAVQYLYARSFFKEYKMTQRTEVAYIYFLGQVEQYWQHRPLAIQAMLALALYRYDSQVAIDIITSLKERSLVSVDMGRYWKELCQVSHYWHDAPVETMALLIEAFVETHQDPQIINEMKVWLLRNKQIKAWSTTKATTEAVYALFLNPAATKTSPQLSFEALELDENIEITVGKHLINRAREGGYIESGTGHFKMSWQNDEIHADMGEIGVHKPSAGMAWGGVYWQYFEQLDKITTAETSLKLNKKLFKLEKTSLIPVMRPVESDTPLLVGDLVRVRIEIKLDRDMDYVHLKDMRASGFEPVNVRSCFKYQYGLGYYESTRDAASHFFVEKMSKGTYVFEYDLRANNAGEFSNGITSIQCMYAPEFAAHSEGIRVTILENKL